MRLLVTSSQMATMERASGAAGVSTFALMERAGAAVASEAQLLAAPTGRVLVLCGRGNNGGDGLVAARRLAAAGRQVLCELMPGDEAKMPKEAFNALKSAGLAPGAIPSNFVVGPGDVVIDALFGTGLSRAPGGAYAEAIARIARWRSAGAKVIAVDVPSGLHTDTGKPYAPCVEADVTLTFGHVKVGLALEPGASLAGELKVVDIGLRDAATQAALPPHAFLLEEGDIRSHVPVRRADSHKGTYGHVLVVAGSSGKTGAAALAAKAALRGGAGLVTVATRREALPWIMAHAPEVMGYPLASWAPLGHADLDRLLDAAEDKQAMVIGPGIPRGDDTARLLRELFERLEIPIVVDADALNAIGGDRALVRGSRAPLILTPHPGEMGRLLGKTSAEVQRDRMAAARELASEGVVAVLKGARTIVVQPDGTAFVNPTGNPGMATGGTGDVLSGLLGALLAQGFAPIDAALAGVYVHGLAGDLAASVHGQMGLIAGDVVEALGGVWAAWSR